MFDKQTVYLIALSTSPNIGPIRLKTLLDYFKSPQAVWEIKEIDLKKIFGEKIALGFIDHRKNTDPTTLYQDIVNKNVRVLTLLDKDYPKNLKEIHDPPVVLFYRGDILPRDTLALAVVGSRKMSPYGKEVTEFLVKDLVRAHLTIVSGLAYGVDAVAHQTALEGGGRTIAVLGGGLNKIYPSSHTKLAESIWSGRGAVVSEFLPDEPSLPQNFPLRNRIISGLSLGVLVTEADKQSGSLITANCALEQGREVFAVGGSVFSNLAKGPAGLIKQGAKMVTEANDILEELNLEISKEFYSGNQASNSKEEEVILNLLKNGAKHSDEIIRESGLEIPKANSLLSLLELKGKIKNLGNNQYRILN